MCCTVTPNATHNHLQVTPWVGGLRPGSCGCGCMDKNQTALHLEHYQEHLKAELKSVERQINALQKSGK